MADPVHQPYDIVRCSLGDFRRAVDGTGAVLVPWLQDFSLGGVRELLARDASFRRYMYAMSLFGAGNLTLIPVLVVCFDEVLHLPAFWQIAVTTAVPVLVIPFAIQPWASYLDRHHVVAFRSVHGWVLVTASALLAGAILLRLPMLVWPGALLMAGLSGTTTSRHEARKHATWRCT